jgi:hypothetical protein
MMLVTPATTLGNRLTRKGLLDKEAQDGEEFKFHVSNVCRSVELAQRNSNLLLAFISLKTLRLGLDGARTP